MLIRRSRFFIIFVRELAKKYTALLILGFLLGVGGSLAALRTAPYVYERLFSPTIRIGIIGEFTPSSLPQSVQQLLSIGLTTLTSDGTPESGLAQSWEATDSGKTYIFHLREGPHWHTGKDVTAYDVNYNIKNVQFTVRDKNTVVAKLDDAYAPFPTILAKPILQAGLVGFGTYRVSFVRLKGDIVVYVRLAPVTPGAELPVREYRFYRTEAQAITAYKIGDIDRIEDLSSPAELSGWRNASVEAHTRYDRIVTLFFNTRLPIFSSRSTRLALAYGIPPLGEEKAISPISRLSWAYSDKQIRLFSYQPDQVKTLLDNAQFASSSGRLTISTFAPYVSIAQKIADTWTSLGVPTTVRVENKRPQDFQLFLGIHSTPPDPDQYLFWHQTQQETNVSGYVNVKIDKLLEDGRKEQDRDRRIKIYQDFARRLVDDAPAVFLYYPSTYTVTRMK